MAYDFKKEEREFYLPTTTPQVITMPPLQYIGVQGRGNPNEPNGPYQHAIELLYGIAFTIKMSKKGTRPIQGYFDYVVPPLEGFWWQEGTEGIDYGRKQDFQWLSVIRLPSFVSEADFEWARQTATDKKHIDFSPVQYCSIEEGLCVQCMHIGSFDSEPATVLLMDQYLVELGYENDFNSGRHHHEIYLSDARRIPQEKMRTVVRHPIRIVKR